MPLDGAQDRSDLKRIGRDDHGNDMKQGSVNLVSTKNSVSPVRGARLALVLAFTALLGACAANKPMPVAAPPPDPAEVARQQAEARGKEMLAKGVGEYEAGSYAQAEATLLSPDIWAASDTVKIAALKHLAFTYCVTERPALCRQSFERALQLDPNFDLTPAEHNHPLWGPEFKYAKQTQ
ncbi:MAG TPA: TssQ family T6SS-associated lipoprotein [Tahibacter sp.]|nr:TssQ family T6SS-associated lipoprotein [Tahibacter sp.]